MRHRSISIRRALATLLAVACAWQPVASSAQVMEPASASPPARTVADAGDPAPSLNLGCFDPAYVYARPVAPDPSQMLPGNPAEERERGRLDAERDAPRDVSGFGWFAIGCLVPAPGILAAYLMDPHPPASRLMGKSSDYVAAYTGTWAERTRAKRTKNAWIGAAVGIVLAVGALVALAASDPYYYY